jgi:hypothetical protein
VQRYHQVVDLLPGQVIQLWFDPDEPHLRWPVGWEIPVGWLLVSCTVEANTPMPGTATSGTTTGRDETVVYQLGHPDLHRLDVLHEGAPWSIRIRGNASVTVLPTHHPVCGSCGELWPCREERLDQAAARFATELDHLCAHCGESVAGRHWASFFDGVTTRRFHTAKKYRGPDGRQCAAALDHARRALPGAETMGEKP